MALFRPYTTEALVREYTGEDDTDLTSIFEDAINLASRAIEEMCQKDFWFHDHSVTMLEITDWHWVIGSEIFLPWPIRTLTEIELHWGEDTDPTVSEDMTYRTYNDSAGNGAIIRLDRVAPDLRVPSESVYLAGTFGFGDGADETIPPVAPVIPAQVQRAATIIAGVWTGTKRREEVDLTGQRTSILSENIPTEAKKLLAPFTRMVL